MKIHHVAFRTHDLPRLLAFYTDTLGFVETRRRGDEELVSVWLAAGDAIVMLERAEKTEPRDLAAFKELIAFTVTTDERAMLRSRLISAGFAIDGETDFTTYVRDPDGRRIGFSHFDAS